jgi:flavin reductase (DIM6/NTAB) family NADH-FMN oxidoreductase RutF
VNSKNLGLHTIYFGEIVEVDARSDVALDSRGAELAKLDPVVFTPFERAYYKIGPRLGSVTEMGKVLEK